jgi:sec-independent protein translocase protein TatC
MKVSLIASFFITFPFLLLQLWNFISPALKPKERKLCVPFLFASILAFLLGFFCAYRWAIPYLFHFLIGFNQVGDEVPLIRLGDYITLVLQLLLGSALVFETPIILAVLGKLGIITAPFLKHIRPKAYVGLTVVAAVLTPTPDAFTMVLALVPLILLYELGVGLVTLLSSKKN